MRTGRMQPQKNHYMKKYIYLLASLVLVNAASCKAQPQQSDDYICQDGFYFSRDCGTAVPNDTALNQGFLSDSTRYFFYKNERIDYARDSCIVQRVMKEAEQAVIVVGNIEYEKALRRLEEILKKKDGFIQIPLYTESNFYRFDGVLSQFKGRIDLRIPIVPSVHPDLRPSSFSIHHLANFCLLSLYTDYRFTQLENKGGLPESVSSVHVYPNLILDGKDRECLCLHIESKPGMEEQAFKDVRRCLELFVREKCSEPELNMLREQFRQMVKMEYFDSSIFRNQNGKLGNHFILKRIGDAYALGNELYDFDSEGECLIRSSSVIESEFISAMYEATILHNTKK